MNRTLSNILEFINPSSVVRPSVPPMDAGLRANDLLDTARPLLTPGVFEPDSVVAFPDGRVCFSSGAGVWQRSGETAMLLAELPGLVTALVLRGSELIAAVEGIGLVQLAADGAASDYCTDELVRTCVTDIAVLDDASLVVSIGSRRNSASGWARALLNGDRSGALVTVDERGASSLADGLAWPSGLAFDDDGSLLVSVSFDHSIERRSLGAPRTPPTPLLSNLPFYPGRIRAGRDGWWVAAPYVRNRATELVLDEPGLCRDLVADVSEGEWPVPRLRLTNLYREPMQLGQLRVLGVLKPWAPARSYGLLFLLGHDGRVQRSYHSRVGGITHGVTAVVEIDDRLVFAARGAQNLLELGELES